MARRNNNKANEAVNPEATEEASMTSTESVEQTTESTENTEVEINLDNFNSAVKSVLEEADTSTGELPATAISTVNEAYRELDGAKAKNAAKKALNELMKSAMNEMNIVLARTYLQLSDSLTPGTSGGGAKKERVPADPTEAAVQRVATLQLAREFVVVPEGVAEDFSERVEAAVAEAATEVQAYIEYLQSDEEDKTEPEASVVVKSAAKLALGKSAKAGGRVSSTGATYTGERRDIAKHILAAFEDQPSGTFLTVAEIRKFRSDEYGDNPPSAGAISARLFPQSGKSTMVEHGIVPDTNEKGNKGAHKK